MLVLRCGLVFLAPFVACWSDDTQQAIKLAREAVVKADTPQKKAQAYKALFQLLGREGLSKLSDDEDIGLALQAKWECQKKLVKRTVKGRTEATYDSDKLKEFVAFLKTRSNCTPPEWWVQGIGRAGVDPGKSHGFGYTKKWPDLKKSTSGGAVPEGSDLLSSEDTLTFTRGSQKLTFAKKGLGIKTLNDALAFSGDWSGERGAIAIYDPIGGSGGRVACFEVKGGKQLWKADIWAVHRVLLIGNAPHCLEVVATKDSVVIFGQETSGMYVEAFDSTTGKCRFRFCTSYWMNFSEEWNLK